MLTTDSKWLENRGMQYFYSCLRRIQYVGGGILLHQEEEYRAYVLIKVESGKDMEVFTKIRDLQHKFPIRELAALYGDFDIIVKVQMNKPDDLENFIFSGLRPIQGIADTQTLIAARSLEFK
jgi:DNA-binding Lrp family transcriptional regulator